MSVYDSMVIVGGIACSLGIGRLANAQTGYESFQPELALTLLRCLIRILAGATVGALIASLKGRPRPSWGLFHRPGISASAVASVPAVLGTAGPFALRQLIRDPEFYEVLPILIWVFSGLAVGAGWAFQAAVGEWKPRLFAHDRLGRCLGAVWLAGPLLWLLLQLHR